MRVVRRRRFPIAAMAVVVLLALGTIGLVYGNWEQRFTINGTVQTAEINAKWLVPNQPCGASELKGKEVATATIKLNGGKMFINIVNGYPGFRAVCSFTLQNNGKLPVAIGSISLKPGLNLTSVNCAVVTSSTGAQVAMTCPELSVVFTDGIGSALNQNDKAVIGIKLEVLKLAVPGRKYGFEAQVCIEPFNTDQC